MQKKAENLYVECEAQLPWEMHFKQLDPVREGANIPTDLRAENIYWIDLASLCPMQRSGLYVPLSFFL